MPTVTVPDHAPRRSGETLDLRTDRPAWLMRWEGWLWCSLPVRLPDMESARVLVPVRLGVETALANNMAVEVMPERDDPLDRPVLIRASAREPAFRGEHRREENE